MVLSIILSMILTLLLYYYFYIHSIPNNYPPGPRAFPIWGGYYEILLKNFKFPYKAIHDMSKSYKSNVIGTYFGKFPTVIACDLKSIREVLTRPEFQGRIDGFVPRYRSYGKLYGILFTEGKLWEEQRRFMLKNMRDFGYGRRHDSLEGKFQEDIQDLIDVLHKSDLSICKEGLVLVPEIFYALTANMITLIYNGERRPFQQAYELADEMIKMARVIDTTTGALNMTPWMRYFAPSPIGFTITKRVIPYIQKFVKELIAEHEEKITDETTTDFIERYLHEIKRQMGSDSTTFSIKQLELIGMDMIFTGTVTLSFMMGFIILLLAKHEGIQEKCAKEIDEVVGRNRLPNLTDRFKMPYVEAMIRESMRYQTLIPLGVPHKAMVDTTLSGYFIPKGTMVMTSLYSIHRDKNIWENPDSFIPERFIDSNGNLIKHDPSLPFGRGKRVCVGETFARQNMFMIISGLLQNFSFTQPEGKRLPELNENISAINESPKPFWVKVTPRP